MLVNNNLWENSRKPSSTQPKSGKLLKHKLNFFHFTRSAYKQPRQSAMRKGIFIYLWFSRQRRTSISCEVRRYGLELVMCILAVQVSKLPMGQDANEKTVVVGVIHLRDWKLTLISYQGPIRSSLISITSVDFMHYLRVLVVFENGHIEVQILQSIRQILAVDICSSPARKDEERRREETIDFARTDEEVHFSIILPALQRRDVEIFVIEDHCNASLGVIHVVLRRKSCSRHFRVGSSVATTAAWKLN